MSTALFKKLNVAQLANKFPAFHATRVHSCSLLVTVLSQMNPVSCRHVLMISTHLRLGLPVGLLSFIFSDQIQYAFLSPSPPASTPKPTSSLPSPQFTKAITPPPPPPPPPTTTTTTSRLLLLLLYDYH
jgi:hypothetical protein